jgi:mRNA-degrading endonuclease RelE of RelBE toxin-antitoxin system
MIGYRLSFWPRTHEKPVGIPQYRLRADDFRVFYDVSGKTVEVLAIVPKSEANSWLVQFGNPE